MLVWAALLIVGLAAGCGSATSHHSTTVTAAPVDGCLRLNASARTVKLHPVGTPALSAVLIGHGRTTFVLSDESDETLCSWLPFVKTLTADGYSALLYDYLDIDALPADAEAGGVAARAAGATRVVLMGASVGARASIRAAASHPAGVIAVVSLSAERTVSSDPSDLVPVARHVTLPTLLISTRQDPFVNGATGPLLRALASHRKQALILPGLDHGTALLSDSYGPRVRAAILAFIAGANR